MTALYDKIHKEMPDNRSGTLSPEESADVLAYVLRSTSFRRASLSFRMTQRH